MIVGPPGAGKGTQAADVAAHYGLAHLATGDILRKETADGTSLGLKAKKYMESGGLVPDSVMTEMIGARVVAAARERGFILDGYPRTVAQAKALDGLFSKNDIRLDAILSIAVADEVLLKRLANRQTCPKCQAVYHPQAKPSKQAEVCDRDEAKLVTRPDDTEEVIRRRLSVYREQTAPVLAFYAPSGLLREIDGDRPIDVITRSIREAIDATGGGRG
jgi:adenylate kinase